MSTLTIDWTRCVGHGVCIAAFGEQLRPDRWGYPDGVTTAGVPVPTRLEQAARVAVATCPAAALRLSSPTRQDAPTEDKKPPPDDKTPPPDETRPWSTAGDPTAMMREARAAHDETATHARDRQRRTGYREPRTRVGTWPTY